MNSLKINNGRSGAGYNPDRPNHFHWIIWAYGKRVLLPDEKFYDVTSVEVLADTRREAIAKAEMLLPRMSYAFPDEAGYAVRQVIEHMDGACNQGLHHG